MEGMYDIVIYSQATLISMQQYHWLTESIGETRFLLDWIEHYAIDKDDVQAESICLHEFRRSTSHTF